LRAFTVSLFFFLFIFRLAAFFSLGDTFPRYLRRPLLNLIPLPEKVLLLASLQLSVFPLFVMAHRGHPCLFPRFLFVSVLSEALFVLKLYSRGFCSLSTPYASRGDILLFSHTVFFFRLCRSSRAYGVVFPFFLIAPPLYGRLVCSSPYFPFPSLNTRPSNSPA